jgi:hypothetical protein
LSYKNDGGSETQKRRRRRRRGTTGIRRLVHLDLTTVAVCFFCFHFFFPAFSTTSITDVRLLLPFFFPYRKVILVLGLVSACIVAGYFSYVSRVQNPVEPEEPGLQEPSTTPNNDFLTNPNACGKNGAVANQAAGQFCKGGYIQCPTGLTVCGTECIDTTSNADHCNGCSPCPPGESCVNSGCVCVAPNQECNGLCTPLTTEENCGMCGHACPVGWKCWTDSTTGMSSCIDPDNDAQHCGDENLVCSSGSVCYEGACENLNSSMVCCGVAGRNCADLGMDACRMGQCVSFASACGSQQINCYDQFPTVDQSLVGCNPDTGTCINFSNDLCMSCATEPELFSFFLCVVYLFFAFCGSPHNRQLW